MDISTVTESPVDSTEYSRDQVVTPAWLVGISNLPPPKISWAGKNIKRWWKVLRHRWTWWEILKYLPILYQPWKWVGQRAKTEAEVWGDMFLYQVEPSEVAEALKILVTLFWCRNIRGLMDSWWQLAAWWKDSLQEFPRAEEHGNRRIMSSALENCREEANWVRRGCITGCQGGQTEDAPSPPP